MSLGFRHFVAKKTSAFLSVFFQYGYTVLNQTKPAKMIWDDTCLGNYLIIWIQRTFDYLNNTDP